MTSADKELPGSGLSGRVHVVSHTHWDREWYLPFETYRLRLVTVVDRLLDLLERDGAFRHFVLDGQTAALDDYLEIRPEAEERIRRLVVEGRLGIGPWTILPDEFLVSGEATVRNLQRGMRRAARLGGASTVGYMPDSFGHIAQMPQLLQRAGLDSFVYWRGHGSEIDQLGSEWWWEAPDGSRVLAVNLPSGYCNASSLGYDEIWEIHVGRRPVREQAARQFLERLQSVAAASNGSVWLMNNGCDHHPAQEDLPGVLERVRQLAPGLELHHTGHAAFLHAVRAQELELKVWSGELKGGRQAHLLSGVWSARLYLKQLNERCQRLLAEELEPLDLLLEQAAARGLPPGLLDRCWKGLLLNHPHDSICGCSIDEVHREMETRFHTLAQAGEEGLRQLMGAVLPLFAPHHDQDTHTCLAAFNTLPFPRRDVLRRWVILLPEDRPIEELELVDEAGQALPFRVLERHWLERFWGIDYRSCVEWREQDAMLRGYLEHYGSRIVRQAGAPGLTDQFVLLEFQPELPALCWRHFHLRARKDALPASPLEPSGEARAALITAEGAVLENDLLKVLLKADGRFDLLHKASGHWHRGLGLLEDREDAGDEYDWSPAEEAGLFHSAGLKGLIHLEEDNGLSCALRCDLGWPLPVGLAPHRRCRSEELRPVALSLRLRLQAASPLLEVEVELDNQVRDHRLRLVLPTGLASGEWITHGHFDMRRRQVEMPSGADWAQPPQGTAPQQEFALVEAQGRGLALFNRGLPEIEAWHDGEGRVHLALTLLRGVEWLSRDDLSSRRHQNAGPTLHTPEAQCLGSRRMQLAIMPYTGTWREAGVRAWSRRWHVPALLRQGVADGRRPETLPLVCQSQPEGVEISACRRHPERGTLLLRLCNLTDKPIRERLQLGAQVEGAWRCSLLDERLETLPAAQGALELELGVAEIYSLEVRLATS